MSVLWNISNIDLSEDVKPLSVTGPVQGVFVVFWWRGIPLGHRQIKATQLPMSAAQLASVALQEIVPAVNHYFHENGLETQSTECSVRSSHTAKLESKAQVLLKELLSQLGSLDCHIPNLKEPVNTSICVIIPTRDRPSRLFACLQSIEALRLKPQEIIVVDNAPQTSSIRSLVDQFPCVRHISETQIGSSVARNTGVRHSVSPIIVFMDDDMIVHPEWLTRLRQCFRDPSVAVATGLVLPAELHTEAQLVFERRFSFIRGYNSRTFDTNFYKRTKTSSIPIWEIGGSGNMAIRREVFEQLGGFDERLGAGRAGCSEDTELFYRVLSQGWHCRYEPRAVTYHYHRSNMDDLKQQFFSYMRGNVTASLIQYAKHKNRGNLCHLLWTLPTRYAWYCLQILMRNPDFRFSTLRAEISGCLSGLWHYLKNRSCPKVGNFSMIQKNKVKITDWEHLDFTCVQKDKDEGIRILGN